MASNKSILQFPNKKQFIVTVPKGLVLAKGWKQGDTIEFTFDSKGNLVMKKIGENPEKDVAEE
jgi:bifunctional DNA-binding transcriptional regulator/antitoxin component of YhaV-PrlF toxin-antitoxin module